ncbi:MAG TPA: hypothetical protein VNN73_22025 [Blastocatellia bacterium]|nr:hypothetical protein [Blastocatellia bacterium]
MTFTCDYCSADLNRRWPDAQTAARRLAAIAGVRLRTARALIAAGSYWRSPVSLAVIVAAACPKTTSKREADLKRLTKTDESSRKVEEEASQIERLKERRKRRKGSSVVNMLDIGMIFDLTDLFS